VSNLSTCAGIGRVSPTSRADEGGRSCSSTQDPYEERAEELDVPYAGESSDIGRK
jgi:hypothetical protein